MRRIALVVLLNAFVLVAPLLPGSALASGCAPEHHPGGQWAMFGRDLANTRHQPHAAVDSASASALVASWTFTAPSGDFSGTPIVADGCVFAGSNAGGLYALDADTGEQVWSAQVDGAVKSSAAVADGRVFFTVSGSDGPFAVALDAASGVQLWHRTLADGAGSEAYSSPIVYDGMVFAGVSGVSLEDGTGERVHAGFSLLDAETGAVLKRTYTVPQELWDDGYGGGGFWPTPAVDAASGFAYAATGNPYDDRFEHENVNAIVKIDLRRDSATFGEIVASFRPDHREPVPGLSEAPACEGEDRLPVGAPQDGSLVGHLDFGASPNLFTDASGRLRVGNGQKSGVYYVVDAETFEPVRETLVGPYGPFGGIVSSAAYDGRRLYGGVTPAGYLFALDDDTGDCSWVAPVADGLHYGHPVASSDGIVWTTDLKGFLHGYDADTGVPLVAAPLWAATAGRTASTFGGVSVARNTVFVAVGLQVAEGNIGSIVAFRMPSS